MKSGAKTSELWVVVAVITPWILQQLGVDMSDVITNADQLRQAINTAHKNISDLPVWVAGAYVVGRKVLKWKDIQTTTTTT
jgi:hypothetical protein